MSPTRPNVTAVPLLRVSGLTKSFGANEVVKSIDFTLEAGKVLVLIGPSGSGKTTVLRCLNGLETPEAGTLTVADELAIDFAAPATKKQVLALRDCSAMVFQHYNLFPHMTVLQNVIEGPVQVKKIAKQTATDDALTLLDSVGLADKRDAYPFELSGGQQQRVGIVRALALAPRILLFDEPTSSLDPELVGDVLRVMQDLARQGWTMIVVTHELEFARQVADEVLFLDGGHIVERGTPGQIFTAPREERTKRFLARLLHPLD